MPRGTLVGDAIAFVLIVLATFRAASKGLEEAYVDATPAFPATVALVWMFVGLAPVGELVSWGRLRLRRRSLVPIVPLPVSLALAVDVLDDWLLRLLFLAAGFTVTVLGVELAQRGRDTNPRSFLLATPTQGALRHVDTFGWGLLVFAGVLGWQYVLHVAETTGARDNDAAYYFAVARHIATHGTLDEPIVWHHLVSPDHAVHPAFDYWQGLTSLVVVPSMWLFGPTHLVAATTIAWISFGTIVLFAYLVVVLEPFTSRAAQVFAVTAFALSPQLVGYRIDTETAPVFHAFLVGSLVALARGRHALAAGLAFALLWVRADGLVTFAMITLVCVLRATRRERLHVVITLAVLGSVFVGTNLVRFGTVTPPGARFAPLLREYMDIYRLSPELSSPSDVLARRFDAGIIKRAFEKAWQVLASTPFLGAPVVFFLFSFAALGARRDRSLAPLMLALVTVGPFVLAWTGGVVFSEFRTLSGLVPAMVLATAYGIDHCLVRLGEVATPKSDDVRERSLGSMLPALGAAFVVFLPIQMYEPLVVHSNPRLPFIEALEAIDETLDGGVVATSSPWWVAAYTHSPAVVLPIDDNDAIETVLARYGVAYLLFADGDAWPSNIWELWIPYRFEGRHELGPFRFHTVIRNEQLVLVRVSRAEAE